MNTNKLLQLIIYLLFLTSEVGFLLAITIIYHLPVMTVWVILAITAATGCVCAVVLDENTTNQKDEEK